MAGCAQVIDAVGRSTVVNATPAAFPYALILAQAFRQSHPDQPDILINPSGTQKGWQDLDQGMAQAFIQLDQDRPSYQTSSLGWTGIAIVASSQNNLRDEITLTELRTIFLHLDDPNASSRSDGATTRLYVYDPESDIQRQFNRQVLGGLTPSSKATLLFARTSLPQALAADPFGIGFTTCIDVPEHQKILLVDGALPDFPSVMAQAYPLRMPILISTKSDGSPALQAFIGWAQSIEGQAVLARVCPAGGER